MRFLTFLLALLFAVPAHADWSAAKTRQLLDLYSVTEYTYTWVGAATDSTAIDFSVCRNNRAKLQAKFDPSYYGAQTNATIQLRECHTSSPPNIRECAPLNVRPSFSETEWRDVLSAQGNYLQRPYLIVDALTNAGSGNTARLDLRCLVPLEEGALAGGSTTTSDGQSQLSTDWSYGVWGALARAADQLLTYRWEVDLVRDGRRAFYPVTAIYTVGTLPATGCDAANEVGTFAWTSDGGAYECMVTDGGAGAYGWVVSMNPPYMWLTSATGGATGGAFVFENASQAHQPGPRIMGYEDSANECQQVHYLGGGGGRGLPFWGRNATVDAMLVALGYVASGTKAFAGYTRLPTNIVLDPAAASASAAVQNFTDGWGYVIWGEAVTAISRRLGATSSVAIPDVTLTGTFLSGPARGALALKTEVEAQNPASSTNWNARFSAKTGFPFLAAEHKLADPESTGWSSGLMTTGSPDWSNAAGEDLRPTFTVCSVGGATASLRVMKVGLNAFIYDYD